MLLSSCDPDPGGGRGPGLLSMRVVGVGFKLGGLVWEVVAGEWFVVAGQLAAACHSATTIPLIQSELLLPRSSLVVAEWPPVKLVHTC